MNLKKIRPCGLNYLFIYYYLSREFYDIVFKIKHKLYSASRSAPPPPRKNSGCLPGSGWLLLPDSWKKRYFNPLKTKRISFTKGLSAYRAVNTLHFGYKNQSLNVL
jgi:hypothetical protein